MARLSPIRLASPFLSGQTAGCRAAARLAGPLGGRFRARPGLHRRHRPPRLLVAAHRHQHRPPRGERRPQRPAQVEISARPTRSATSSTAQTVSRNVCPRNVNTATLERRQARSTKATGTDRLLQRPEHPGAPLVRLSQRPRPSRTFGQCTAEALSAVSVGFQIPSTTTTPENSRGSRYG